MSTTYTLNGDLLSAGGLVVTPSGLVLSRKVRLASGTLTQDLIATKRSWKFKYSDLPGLDSNVRDGGLGRDSLWSLYDTGGVQTLVLPAESGIGESVEVLFGDAFPEERTQVNPFWRWNVEFTLEEV